MSSSQLESQQAISQALTPVDTVRTEQLWHSYFGTNSMMDVNRPQIISTLFNFFCDHQATFLEPGEIERHGRVSIDFAQLRTMIPVGDFPAMLKDEPALVLSCLAVAAHQAVVTLAIPLTTDRVMVRMANYSPITALKNLKANFVDRFVALRGNVVRISNVRPLVTAMAFKCTKCGFIQHQTFTDGKYQSPSGCEGKCKGKNFEPGRSTASTVDFQRIRIQEILSADQHDQGRVPRTIDCELTGDLVDCCIPGDVVTVSGVVKARKSEAPKGGGRNRSRTVFLLYLDVNAIDNSKESDQGKLDVVQMKPSDLAAVNKIAHIDGLFPYLINCLCPSIYGHEIVKAGLLLALIGGSQKNAGDRNKIAVRGDPHVLIVGDPGMGKSQMLRAVCKIAPRGVYVCGNTATSSGLTVTMVREGKGGDSSLEAGALVLGDQGCCCIDEFDKMGQEHNALLEAMEQQSISIAKAGIVCSLAARTSVLAAANPVGGHYNRAKTVSENLKISSPLLSRFDLIFILLDKPDEERDQMLSEHVIALHSGGPKSNRGMTPRSITRRMDKDEAINSQLPSASSQWRAEGVGKALSTRLRLSVDEMQAKGGALPAILLRKYIAYARKYVKPKLSSDAKKILEDFYLKLRKEHQSADGTPITTRQLESMIRLGEARAKSELRDVVTEADAIDVVDIMKESLYDVFADEIGHIDVRRSGGMSKAKSAKAFYKLLNKQAQAREVSIWSMTDMAKIAKESGIIPMDDFNTIIDSLNREGSLLNKGGGKYQIQSSQF